MWTSVLLSAIIFNAIMLFIHMLGPKGVVLTWIPGRTIVLIASLLHKPELIETLQYTWAAGIVPVVFLIPLHIGVDYLFRAGRTPRFSCASLKWGCIWLTTITMMVLAVLLIGMAHSQTLNIALGALAVVLNIYNLQDAPQHLQSEHGGLTIAYVIGTNAIVLGVLAIMNALLDAGKLVWAGIVSNIPLLALVLIASSTFQNTPDAIRMTRQHVYMMSYQIWPNMAFVGILWASIPMGSVNACIIASVGTLLLLGIQFYCIKKML